MLLYPLSRHYRKELGAGNAILPPLRHPAMRAYLSPNQSKRGGKMIVEHEGWNRHLLSPLDLDEKDIEALADEFEQFHRVFRPVFYRVEQLNLSRRYLQGLMSSLKRKSVEPIAFALMEPKRMRSLQLFMSSGKWQTETLATLHRGEAAKTLADENGVLSVDSSEFVKKGKESVGVARQWCGRLGKVENCQSGVFPKLFGFQWLWFDRPSVVFTGKVVFRRVSKALAKMQDSCRDHVQNKAGTDIPQVTRLMKTILPDRVFNRC